MNLSHFTALQNQVDSAAIAGVVARVPSTTKVLGVEAVGLADLATGRPMQTDTMFWIASNDQIADRQPYYEARG